MQNKKERLLLSTTWMWYFAAGLLGPLFAVFAQKIGGDVLEISWAWATYLIVTGILIVVVGKISDSSIGKEKLLMAGATLNALFTFSYLLVSSPIHLFFVEAGLGLASALAWPTWDALYAKYEDKKHDGLAWGLAAGGEFFMGGIGMVIGGLIVAYFSFNALFITMGTIQTLATLYQAQLLWMK